MTHHRPDLVAAAPLVAVDGTAGARWLALAKTATIETQVDIVQQSLAFTAQISSVPITAVNVNHGRDGLPLAIQARVRRPPG